MKNAVALFATLLTLCSTEMIAAEIGAGIVTVPQGQASMAKRSPPRTDGLKEIYTTFSSDHDNLYNCCVAYVVSTPESEIHKRYSIAAPFTPTEDGSVRKVIVAMYWVSGVNLLDVSLRADEAGLPGEILKRFQIELAPWDGCCETETLFAKGVPITAGTQYWVVARATADTFGAWNWNSAGLSGPFARKFESSSWEQANDMLPAVRVLGD